MDNKGCIKCEYDFHETKKKNEILLGSFCDRIGWFWFIYVSS
jgi:hypothetical protein